MATKTEAEQALINKINELIATGDAKALVYLAKALEGTSDGTTVQDLLIAQGDMIIRGATGLEVIKIADMLAPYQDALVSGANIKTIGGASILGAGNIEVGSDTTNFEKPDNNIALITKSNQYTIIIPTGFKVKVASTIIELTEDYIVNLNVNGAGGIDTGGRTAGTDYYIFATINSGFIASASKTLPQGYTVDEVRLIGGFHYGLTPEDEAATGNKTAEDMSKIQGINAYSFWDLKFRSICSNDGMVLVGSKWYDIYLLNSEHIDNGTSKAHLKIAAGTTDYGRAIPKIPIAYGGDNIVTYGKLTWFQLCEIAKSHGKQLIGYDEFPTIAYGVTEGKSSSTDAYESVAGKIEHYSNLTSKHGIEQATGVQYVWGRDLSEDGGTRAWQDVTDGRGQIYAAANSPVAVKLGGNRDDGVNAGSRSSNWSNSVWNSNWSLGCRFACDHLKLV